MSKPKTPGAKMGAKLHIDQAKIAAAFRELEESRAATRAADRRRRKAEEASISAESRYKDAERAWRDLPNSFVKR